MALYNNGFPATYTPYYTQLAPVQQQIQSVQPSVQNGRVWVQGEAGAKSYLVAPNNTVDLWDSESPVIYIKSADASGLPSLKILDYTVRETNVNASNTPGDIVTDKTIIYATKTELDGLDGEIKALRKQLDRLTKRMKEDDDE